MASTADTTDRGHRISVAVARMRTEISGVADQPAWSMGSEETRTTLLELTRLVAQVVELELRVVAHADRIQVGDESGATSTASWMAHQTRLTRREAHAEVRLAHALEAHEAVRTDLANGSLLPDQARVIVEAVDALPEDLVDAATVELAEKTLLTYAGDYDAKGLRVLGLRILDVVAPEIGEAHTARQLEQEEREAEAAARFTMSDDGHGKVHGRFTIPALHGAMLSKALHAIAAPKHRAAVDGQAPVPGRPSAERLGRAFMDYIERSARQRGPSRPGAHCLPRCAPPSISAGSADIRAPHGCDWPPGMCHAHHDDLPWHQGGGTSVKDGRLLCPRHHARAHDPTYTMTKLPGGKVAFHRRT